MKPITLTIQVPDGVDVQIATTPAQNGPQAAAPGFAVLGGASPVCPKHGAEKVKPSTKFTGYFCTAQDESTERGYCRWQQR